MADSPSASVSPSSSVSASPSVAFTPTQTNITIQQQEDSLEVTQAPPTELIIID